MLAALRSRYGRLRVLAPFLVLILALSLAACSTSDGGNPSGKPSENGSGNNGESTGDGSPGNGNQAENEPQVPTVRHVEPSEIDGMLKLFVEDNLTYPGVHFFTLGQEVYAMVSWGEKSTGGYEVEIGDLHPNGDNVYRFDVSLKAPEADEAVTQALTYPYDLVAVKARGSRFKFEFSGDVDPERPITGDDIIGPNLIVDNPEPGDTIGQPLKLQGTARVFEANFEAVLEDGHNELFRGPITAQEGAPAWGRFDEEIEYAPTTQQHGTLILTVHSARDGSVSEQVIIPVKFLMEK